MDTTDLLDWPPHVTVKKHPRARHVKIKTSLTNGLELVVPRRFNQKDIPYILEKNRAWIEKQLKILHSTHQAAELQSLPSEITFPSIGQTWEIEYIPSSCKLTLLTRPHQKIVLFGQIENKNNCKKLLIVWIKKLAKQNLLKRLALISQQIKLPYSQAIIRDQKTRWGSCSEDKSISLNYKLLFFPASLCDHVITHELCHTLYLNHSENFWKSVEKFDPQFEIHKTQLKQGDSFIPAWLKVTSK